MKNSEVHFFMFIAAIILGILVSINLGLVNEDKKISVEEYQDAYETRTKLLSEINVLEKKKKYLEEKMLKYDEDKSDSEKRDIVQRELENNKNLLGVTDVEGEGISITLEDGEIKDSEFSDGFIRKQRTIHDNDINELLNDIRRAGAQAISINDQRIDYATGVFCAGQFLNIDGIVKTPAPFKIKIIGDKKRLETDILSAENTLKRLINRGIIVIVEDLDNLEIKSIK